MNASTCQLIFSIVSHLLHAVIVRISQSASSKLRLSSNYYFPFFAGEGVESKLEGSEGSGSANSDQALGSDVKQTEKLEGNATVALLQAQQQGNEGQVHANPAQVSLL